MLGRALLVALVPLAPLVAGLGLTPGAPDVALQHVAGGFSMPLLVTHADDGSGRLFVVEQIGRVHVLGDPVPYLDISSKVRCCGERGLLGLAFAPDFGTSGRLYVAYSRASDGAHVLERLTVAQPAGGRPPTAGEILLVRSDPFANHNGGHLAFGPDGHLYLALGDGGGAGDPQGNGQNRHTLLGKLLRLDVSAPTGYAIPADNPFANGGGLPEIWAYGLRNPWRYSFDRATGDLWIADVGQNLMEEVNFQPAGAAGGANYGWDRWEGILPHEGAPILEGVTFPVITYLHQPHCSVTGGHVYRGANVPALRGWYVYGDFCSGFVWAANDDATTQAAPAILLDTPHLVSSFGEDEAGELYLVHYGGSIHRFVAG